MGELPVSRYGLKRNLLRLEFIQREREWADILDDFVETFYPCHPAIDPLLFDHQKTPWILRMLETLRSEALGFVVDDGEIAKLCGDDAAALSLTEEMLFYPSDCRRRASKMMTQEEQKKQNKFPLQAFAPTLLRNHCKLEYFGQFKRAFKVWAKARCIEMMPKMEQRNLLCVCLDQKLASLIDREGQGLPAIKRPSESRGMMDVLEDHFLARYPLHQRRAKFFKLRNFYRGKGGDLRFVQLFRVELVHAEILKTSMEAVMASFVMGRLKNDHLKKVFKPGETLELNTIARMALILDGRSGEETLQTPAMPRRGDNDDAIVQYNRALLKRRMALFNYKDTKSDHDSSFESVQIMLMHMEAASVFEEDESVEDVMASLLVGRLRDSTLKKLLVEEGKMTLDQIEKFVADFEQCKKKTKPRARTSKKKKKKKSTAAAAQDTKEETDLI